VSFTLPIFSSTLSDWKLANEIGAHIIIPVADRYYGLRDFTIADQDDFGLRFRSML